MRSVIARVLPEPADAITEKFRSSSRAKRCLAAKSAGSITFGLLRFVRQRRMGDSPFFPQEIGIDPERGQRVGARETEVAMHSPQHSKNATLLHAAQFLPELLLRERILELKLRFQFAPWREQGETRVRGTEGARSQRVQGELHASSFDKLFPKFLFGRFAFLQLAQIEVALP